MCLEQKSSLAGPEPPQLDTDDTLVDGPSSCISFSEESLLAEISRLREENRLLREELQRIKSVPMISVATQTGPSDPPSPLLLLQQDQRKQSRGAHSPLPIVGAQKVLLPPPFSSPSSLSLSGSPGTIQQAVSTEETADIVKKDGNNAGDDNGYDSDDNEKTFSITFNPPAKYREDSCPSIKTNAFHYMCPLLKFYFIIFV